MNIKKDHTKVTKAVIAAAGFGTRFLPATKNQPKEMLPIIDKPIIHYLVEEAVASGIKDIILVTRAGHHIMEDYFDNRYELEVALKEAGKLEALEMVRNIPQMANFVYIRQKGHLPYGNATPLLAAKDLIDDDEAFVYMFGDDLTISQKPVTQQLIDVFHEQDASAVLAVQEVPDEEVVRYGTVKYKTNAPYPYEMEAGFEKLPVGEAPSNMAQFGRFIFSHDVIEEAEQSPTGKDDELWVIDILNSLAQKGKKVIAQPIEGEWLTTGDPLRYLKATLKFAMKREDIAEDLKAFIKQNNF
jgi:UTP--glucose-1-phosphate uridylyltransferase